MASLAVVTGLIFFLQEFDIHKITYHGHLTVVIGYLPLEARFAVKSSFAWWYFVRKMCPHFASHLSAAAEQHRYSTVTY